MRVDLKSVRHCLLSSNINTSLGSGIHSRLMSIERGTIVESCQCSAGEYSNAPHGEVCLLSVGDSTYASLASLSVALRSQRTQDATSTEAFLHRESALWMSHP